MGSIGQLHILPSWLHGFGGRTFHLDSPYLSNRSTRLIFTHAMHSGIVSVPTESNPPTTRAAPLRNLVTLKRLECHGEPSNGWNDDD